jgi:hypothetical protein
MKTGHTTGKLQETAIVATPGFASFPTSKVCLLV